MPKLIPPRDRRDKQLLIRLTAEQLEWIETAAFLERQTANEYLYRLASAHLRALKSSRAVRTAFEVRQAYDEAKRRTTTLPERSASGGPEQTQQPEAGDH